MSDLQRYIASRKRKDEKFALNYDQEYEQFKIGELIKRLRKKAGLTQEQLALRVGSKKTAIYRIENHEMDMKLSTLEHLAQAFGKHVKIEFVEAR